MSTVAEEITRISGCREDIKTAIAAKGVTVPTGAKLADCPALIASITGGGGGEVTSFVNTGFTASGAWTYSRPFTATQNTVPQYASATATLNLTTAQILNNIAFQLSDASVFPLDNTPANLTFAASYQSWAQLPNTGKVYGTNNLGSLSTLIGTYTSNKNNSTVTATASFTANTASFPYYIVYEGMQPFAMTVLQPGTATTYTKTGEGKPYPQYPDSTEGTMTAIVSGYEGWSNYLPKHVNMAKTGSYGATYVDGPNSSLNTPYSAREITAFGGGELSSFITDNTTAYTGITDTGYSYSYGEITSAYNGYTGI